MVGNGKFYAGIGSRETPTELYWTIVQTARLLDSLGFVLRSGAAAGADSWFEEGSSLGRKEIYIPWEGFSGRSASEPGVYCGVTFEAIELARPYHDGWDWLKGSKQTLLARDCFQVLGYDLKTPSNFIVCWTPGGEVVGGTGQALRIANSRNIPVFNLGIQECLEYVRGCIDSGRPLLTENSVV